MWFEAWGGPEKSPGLIRDSYACLCDACTAKFEGLTGIDPRELFDPSGRFYFHRPENRAYYEKWIDFRVRTVQEFGRAIIEAARSVNPGININVMFLSDVNVEMGAVREYQGEDIDLMVSELKPDILTVEDAYQDWLRNDLSPSFIGSYAQAYRDRVLELNPDLFIMSHADIGSEDTSRRSWDWIQDFARYTVSNGMHAPSYYEWSISRMAGK